jgi:hypothetical protein
LFSIPSSYWRLANNLKREKSGSIPLPSPGSVALQIPRSPRRLLPVLQTLQRLLQRVRRTPLRAAEIEIRVADLTTPAAFM